MEFKFKQKYTFFFFFALTLHIIVLLFWLFYPLRLLNSLEQKKLITLLALVNIELLLVFYLGLFRKKYYVYYDKIVIKRSFFSDVVISYKDINRIREKKTDTILLSFGRRPSFVIYYTNGKRKKYTIRSDNTELLLSVIKNEIDISKHK